MIGTSVACFAAALTYVQQKPLERFQYMATLPGVPAIKIDTVLDGIGVAQQTARAKGLQARILWIDGTANLTRISSDEKISALVAQIKASGFNTIVLDVKPIVGETLYPSKFAPKITGWKDQTLPIDYDPLRAMVREAKAAGLTLFASMNAFSEGHTLFMQGPGFAKPDWQSVIYEPVPFVRTADSAAYELSSEVGADTLTTVTKTIPSLPAGSFAVTVDRLGMVLDGFEDPGTRAGIPSVPKGGYALVGSGAGAEFLRTHALPQTPIKLDTNARFVPIGERPKLQYPLMMNPNNPEVQQHALDIVGEVLGYGVDGVIYDDRLRYAGIYADFSELTRTMFETAVGRKLHWPDDVFKFTVQPDMTRGIEPGPLYDAWMAWRAGQMEQWMRKVRDYAHRVRPGAQVGVYAGSWYGDYPALGQNYADTRFDAGFWFMTPAYRNMGLASNLDFLITGCYYPVATVYEAMASAKPIGATVEAAGYLSNRVVRDQAWTYAGIALDQFKGDPLGLTNALQAACASTQGVMVFDLSHNIDPMWPVFARAFSQPKIAPHATALLAEVRRKRADLDRRGVKDPPVVIMSGSSGVGF